MLKSASNPTTAPRTPLRAAVIPLLLCAFLLAGCVVGRDDDPLISARLYFGLANAKGEIPAAEFNSFVDTVITPWFPSGLTIFHTDGQWQAPDHSVIKEKSVVVEIAFPDDDTNREHILAIIEQYKLRFKQRSVLLVVSRGSISVR